GQVGEEAKCLFEELTTEKLFQFVDKDHAASLQRDLSTRVKCVDDSNFEPRYLCGMDAAYEGDSAFVAASVWHATNMEIIETATIGDRCARKDGDRENCNRSGSKILCKRRQQNFS